MTCYDWVVITEEQSRHVLLLWLFQDRTDQRDKWPETTSPDRVNIYLAKNSNRSADTEHRKTTCLVRLSCVPLVPSLWICLSLVRPEFLIALKTSLSTVCNRLDCRCLVFVLIPLLRCCVPVVGFLVGCLTSQQHASVFQGWRSRWHLVFFRLFSTERGFDFALLDTGISR